MQKTFSAVIGGEEFCACFHLWMYLACRNAIGCLKGRGYVCMCVYAQHRLAMCKGDYHK